MKSRDPVFDPRRLDVLALTTADATLSGEVCLDDLPRLKCEQVQQAAASLTIVRWRARGYGRAEPGGPRQAWIDLHAVAEVRLTCQRCLEPVATPIVVDRQFQFVRTDAEAERLDAEVDHEVLSLGRDLDLVTLLEDELLLALPLVPRHAECQVPGEPTHLLAGDAVERVPGAFAALGALKRTAS